MKNVPHGHKFVAVLNKKIPAGNIMNALGHITAGLVGSYETQAEMRFADYFDKDEGVHPSMSDNPFIVLRADNSSKLRTLRRSLIENGIHFTDFTHTMVIGTAAEQRERTKDTPEAELEYYGVAMFGEAEQLNQLTKKFSLWRG